MKKKHIDRLTRLLTGKKKTYEERRIFFKHTRKEIRT